MAAKNAMTKKSNTYLILIFISIVYFAVYYFLLQKTETCQTARYAIGGQWYYGILDRYLECRSINELGDALAGAFAPVAFMWLAGTVFLQSQELQAQRQELDETQDVMREQLEVSRQQVEETRASTVLLKIQTEILEREQKQRDEKIADDEFDERLEAFRIKLESLGGISIRGNGYFISPNIDYLEDEAVLEYYGNEPIEIFSGNPLETQGYPVYHLVAIISKKLRICIRSMEANQATLEISASNFRRLEFLQVYLVELIDAGSGLSGKYQIKSDSLGLSTLYMNIQDVKQRLKLIAPSETNSI